MRLILAYGEGVADINLRDIVAILCRTRCNVMFDLRIVTLSVELVLRRHQPLDIRLAT